MSHRTVPPKSKPILVRPRAAQSTPLPRPEQIGERVTTEYGGHHTIRIFSAAWAAGDLEFDDDRD